ncbi:DUF3037 domain-containing protein [Muribaculum sp. NM65_B17]|jgi:hypothetical protein|uniref:DUF3037 domain-containing protein n=1 Tax=unclassified Muribaculum TaxID=2622126 RepID=UPI000F469189|nr:DUF3037 domain-containing protein [Muribaculum sp. NM65_B17]ROT14855.1 DUF3037 domain-containing protein [Muribaculaceae bacterium Isolate-102 (HZI)]TGY04625.1 DUF3037 domain-containing protein [Muribaculum sp. NM65_B17]THG44054.1 DUF3037 domain-containing protein [Muribaculaceae bacterium]
MHDKHLYEYAVIRYVPRVEREEFINVGLIMMCKRRRWLRVELWIDERKMAVHDCELTRDELAQQLSAFTLIGEGQREGGSIASLEAEERFRWLTAVKSACVQTSRPHPGITDNLDATFARLMEELVK